MTPSMPFFKKSGLCNCKLAFSPLNYNNYMNSSASVKNSELYNEQQNNSE